MNPYLILGVPAQAPLPEIKSAWRSLARQFHPDRNPDPQAADRFKAVQAAWEAIRDNRPGVDLRLHQEAVERQRRAAEEIRIEAQRRAWFDRVARAQMAAELEREMKECPRRDLYDVRFYGEPLRQPSPQAWRRENARTAVWDLVKLFTGG